MINWMSKKANEWMNEGDKKGKQIIYVICDMCVGMQNP